MGLEWPGMECAKSSCLTMKLTVYGKKWLIGYAPQGASLVCGVWLQIQGCFPCDIAINDERNISIIKVRHLII